MFLAVGRYDIKLQADFTVERNVTRRRKENPYRSLIPDNITISSNVVEKRNFGEKEEQ